MINAELATVWPLGETFSFEGEDIRFGRTGHGSPLVLVHGWPFSSVVWHRVVPLLARHREVFYFDLLGYGQSWSRAGSGRSLGVHNRVLAALISHWGLQKPDVIAHDIGGLTALRAHLLDGCDYASLLLFDCVALTPFGSGFVQYARKNRDVLADLPSYLHEAMVRAYVQLAAHEPIRDDMMALLLQPWLGEGRQPLFYKYLAELDEGHVAEVEDRYARLRCPVEVLWGEEDTLLPVAQGRDFASRLPDATFRAVPGAGHLVQLDAPEAIVAAALEGLLRTQVR